MKKLLLILLCLPLLFTTCKKEEEVLVNIYGCTNQAANNYNASATIDNGSCTGVCIGCTYQGGIIFYLNENGGGLIAAPLDFTAGAVWGCPGNAILGADGWDLGTGYQNTIDIEAGCTTPGTAADICANLTHGGYTDWFLPSLIECDYMISIHSSLPFLETNFYWTSSENTNVDSLAFGFGPVWLWDGGRHKKELGYVRPIRAF